MQHTSTTALFFSATHTTGKIVRTIADQIDPRFIEYDITQKGPDSTVRFGYTDLLVVGMPVYAGRIPATVADTLSRFKGENSPAIVVCVYGNRDYDDALLELKETIEENGFKVVSAGAFIAQHSIIPSVGAARPDEQDMVLIKEFARRSRDIIQSVEDLTLLPSCLVKGNRPYKTPGVVPFHPKGNKSCNECGICVKQCPVNAIPHESPRKTDQSRCISCGRCIVACPKKARSHGGLLYWIGSRKFAQAYSVRKEPETLFAE